MSKTKVNKSQKVREYQEKHPDAKPIQVATALSRFGVTPGYVSTIKSQMKSTTGSKEQRAARISDNASNELNGQVVSLLAAATFIKACGGVDKARDALRVVGRVVEVVL